MMRVPVPVLLIALSFWPLSLRAQETDPADSPLIVHFIDVGQGDAIFVQFPNGKTMLIDGGENDALAGQYLKTLGVKTIDTLVITHPHLDHIGGLVSVIEHFEVKSIIMPRVASVTTVTFRRLLEVIRAKGLRLTEGKAGLIVDFDPALTVECLAPNGTEYDDLNDFPWS